MKKGEITRYKVRNIVQGFKQRPDIDFEETYVDVNIFVI
jgi:hypothetical protein